MVKRPQKIMTEDESDSVFAGDRREFTYLQVHCRSQISLSWPIEQFLAPVMEESEDDAQESLSVYRLFGAPTTCHSGVPG
jgi:hypothetical protein